MFGVCTVSLYAFVCTFAQILGGNAEVTGLHAHSMLTVISLYMSKEFQKLSQVQGFTGVCTCRRSSGVLAVIGVVSKSLRAWSSGVLEVAGVVSRRFQESQRESKLTTPVGQVDIFFDRNSADTIFLTGIYKTDSEPHQSAVPSNYSRALLTTISSILGVAILVLGSSNLLIGLCSTPNTSAVIHRILSLL